MTIYDEHMNNAFKVSNDESFKQGCLYAYKDVKKFVDWLQPSNDKAEILFRLQARIESIYQTMIDNMEYEQKDI